MAKSTCLRYRVLQGIQGRSHFIGFSAFAISVIVLPVLPVRRALAVHEEASCDWSAAEGGVSIRPWLADGVDVRTVR